MTKQDLLHELEEAIKEERADVEKYKKLATEAEELKECHVKGVLLDIAREEESHERHLCVMLNAIK